MTRPQRMRGSRKREVVLTPYAEDTIGALNNKERALLKRAVKKLEVFGRGTTTRLDPPHEPRRVMYEGSLILYVVFCQECDNDGFPIACQDCTLHTPNMTKILVVLY